MTPNCQARDTDAVRTYDCTLAADHNINHQTWENGECVRTWPRLDPGVLGPVAISGTAMARLLPPAARTELGRELDRINLGHILDHLDRGNALPDTRRPTLRKLITAEQTDADRARQERDEAREQVLDVRGIHESARLTLSDALGLGTGAPWAAITERARELDRIDQASREALAGIVHRSPDTTWPVLLDHTLTVVSGADTHRAINEEARDTLEAAGMTGAHGNDWPNLAPTIKALAAERDLLRRNDEVNRREAGDRRAALAAALGLDTGADWDTIITRAAAVQADADQARADTDAANRHCNAVVGRLDKQALRTRKARQQHKEQRQRADTAEATLNVIRDATDWPTVVNALAPHYGWTTQHAECLTRDLGNAQARRLTRQLRQEHAEHEEHRRSLAALCNLPGDADWLTVTRHLVTTRQELDRLSTYKPIQPAAPLPAEQQPATTLATYHRQLAAVLGQPHTASWPDLITAAFRAYRAADLLAGAERERQAAETRENATAATLRETRKQLAEAKEKYTAGLRKADEKLCAMNAELDRYGDGKERPVLWSVYNRMHVRAAQAEAEVKRLGAMVEEYATGASNLSEKLRQAKAALGITSTAEAKATPREVCCVCGSPDVAYHNHCEKPFCWPCADGQQTAIPTDTARTLHDVLHTALFGENE